MASYQSTTLTIDSKGTQIYFTDTGAVRDSSNYITVVCIHGSLFTGGLTIPTTPERHLAQSIDLAFFLGVFERILPLAAPNNLRLVVLNRRGYPGSTPYTAGEKDNLVHGRKLFLETLGLQVAQFLTAFLDQNDIPRASPDGKSGGLALLGWSLGGLSVLTLLGQSDAIPKSYFTRLGPYLRTCLLLGTL
jgi:pimeloyl-ACP methyl ester carboxylesterase